MGYRLDNTIENIKVTGSVLGIIGGIAFSVMNLATYGFSNDLISKYEKNCKTIEEEISESRMNLAQKALMGFGRFGREFAYARHGDDCGRENYKPF